MGIRIIPCNSIVDKGEAKYWGSKPAVLFWIYPSPNLSCEVQNKYVFEGIRSNFGLSFDPSPVAILCICLAD